VGKRRPVTGAVDRRERFTAVYEENYHRILGYTLRRTNAEEAADVVAETFLVAWRRLDQVPHGDQARLWLYGTARRVLANHDRSRRRRLRLAEQARADAVLAAQGPSAPGPAGEAFSRLRTGERELLALIGWEGLSTAEIAVVYGCSENAVRIRLHRARSHFRKELDRVSAEPDPPAVMLVGKETS